MDKQSNRSKLMLNSLFKDFYKSNKNKLKVANIVNRKCVYSRRTLEWFCSNYSKRKNIIYKTKDGENFDVYNSYKAKLDSYQKKQFDPFKRQREGYTPFNMNYVLDDKEMCIETTVGQLNFFKWCIQKEIIDYIEAHITDIKYDMKNYTDNRKNTIKETAKAPAAAVSISRTCVKKFDGITLKFK